MSGAVWHAACVFHWLRVFMLSCLVWTRGLWVFSLAVCSCPVLHMAGDLFCWPCACVFVLCEHMAFVLVFCVPCALMLIVLTPPILFPDYWFICPTCLPSLPSSFASFIYIYIYAFSRCFYPKAIQAIHFFYQYVYSLGIEPMTFWAAKAMLYHWATGTFYNLLVFAVLCQFVVKCFLFLPCLVLSCPALLCSALPCQAMPCQLPCFSPTG